MKKSLIIYTAIGLLTFSNCGSKKTEKSLTQEVSKDEIEMLESDATESEQLTVEIEQTAQELEEALNELDN